MIWGISLIMLGIIAAPSLLLSSKPNAKELLANIEPYQGWIGIIFCFLGVWGVVTAILNLNWLNAMPIWWATILTGNLLATFLGFMLGSGPINKIFLSDNESARAKAAEFREKLAPKQGKLGLLGIVVGAWMIVASFLFTIV